MGKEYVGLTCEELCDLMCGGPEEEPAEDFVLTAENYYSDEANKRYMSVHQYLDFVGSLGRLGCEERALATINGKWKEEKSSAFAVGSYVDSYFEGTLDKFKAENPDIFTKKGELKAEFKRAEKMIARCEQDKFFMKSMSGEKQKIFTADLFGCEWKCKLDSYKPGKFITDLKTSADIHRAWNVRDLGYVTFIEYFGYITQLAVYQKIVEINTGEKLPCFISVVTKEDCPEIKVIHIDQFSLDNALNEVQANMPTVLGVKNGEIEPSKCCQCDYCKSTEVLEGHINYRDLINP